MAELILSALLNLIVGRTDKQVPMPDDEFFRDVQVVRDLI